jgi:hypothetical protein
MSHCFTTEYLPPLTDTICADWFDSLLRDVTALFKLINTWENPSSEPGTNEMVAF